MILIDNNILSSFARVEALELLFALFPTDDLAVTPAVRQELIAGIDCGMTELARAATLIYGGELQFIPLTAAEQRAAKQLPASLGAGERESIAVCGSRGWTLLTNDRRARNQCRLAGILVYDLPSLLRALWSGGIRPVDEVRDLADQMEAVDGMVIANKEAIFRP